MKRFAILSVIAASALCSAQPAPPEFRAGVEQNPNYGTMHFTTQVGSFKLVGGEGRIDFTFRGSVVINVMPGAKVTVTGNVKKQFDEAEHAPSKLGKSKAAPRVVYFGDGKVSIIGKWRAVQCFGKKISAVWYGQGRVRLSSEFFKDPATGELVTGQFWYNDPSDKNYWFNGAIQEVPNPPYSGNANPGPQVVPKERKG